MKETGSTRKETIEILKELETFGLIGFNTKGAFRLREVWTMREIKLISASHYQTSERFYALPKILFENPIYENMRLDAKVAYAMLKDRLDLSFKNNWIDEEGNIYLVYSNSNLMKILNCSKSTLLRIKKQLNEYGLIREVQQSTSKSGNLANRIYLGLLQGGCEI